MFETGLGTHAGAAGGLGPWHQRPEPPRPHPATYGPRTATEAGFGSTVGGFSTAPAGQPGRLVHAVLSVGSLSLLALIAIWCSLPS